MKRYSSSLAFRR